MNPYNQQYPYNFSQNTPGPAQPQWQAPPRRQGWGDPRPGDPRPGDPRPGGQQQQPGGPNSPISPFQPSPFGYHPPPPPPPPAGIPFAGQQSQPSQYNTATWGVKYNQTPQQYQEQEPRPPLPPRPTSAASQPSPQPEHTATSSQWQQGYGGSPGRPQQQNQWADPYYGPGQPQSQAHDIPPPPPPRPPEYQTPLPTQHQQQNFPQDHYSQHPPTHNYDPQMHNSHHMASQQPSHQYNPSTTSIPPQRPVDYAPVSPIEPDASQFYSSALGTGGPSDWEHFGGPSTGMSPEEASPPPRMEATATPGFDAPMQTKPRPPRDQVMQSMSSSTFESPASMHATLAATPQHEPVQPTQHHDSVNSVFTDDIKRTGTIDSVIQAWSNPLKIPPKHEAQAEPRPTSQGSAQAANVPPVQERIVEVEKVVEKIVDPYDDLEPEVKASLKRYATMLRKESAAQTDEEKFSVFETFIAKELRIRSMMYAVEPKLKMVKDDAKTIERSHSVGAAAIVAPSPKPPVEKKLQDVSSGADQIKKGKPTASNFAADSRPDFEHVKQFQAVPKAPQSSISAGPSQGRHESRAWSPPRVDIPAKEGSPQRRDDVVTVNPMDDEPEYSPGGRPRVKRPGQINTSRPTPTSQTQSQQSQLSPGANAPMVLEDYVMPGPPSPSANAPMVVEPPSATDRPQSFTPLSARMNAPQNGQTSTSKPSPSPIIKFEPARPAYTPFKYNPNVEAPRLPADQSYSTLRKEGNDSGRLLVHKPALPAGLGVPPERSNTPSRRVQDETFIGLIRQQSVAIRKTTTDLSASGPIAQLRPGTPARMATPAPARQITPVPKVKNLMTETAALKQVLPDTVPDSYGLSQHTKANSVKAAIDTIPDSFGFIHDTVVDWDRENRKIRKNQEEEHSARQADAEQRIDDLFNDNEIGYADIGNLEAEFKLAEAERKYADDLQELESFTQRVYVPVTEKLEKEVAQLNAQYTIAIDLLDLESESSSRLFKSGATKAEMAFVMNCVLSLFNKLELRHQKIAEANVERERRRKKLELTVLYTNGDTSGVKSLEAEFAVAEKMQVLHEARRKDTRANKLMDTFDRATVRGLGDNQTYVDDLVVRIREMKELILKDPDGISESVYESDGPRDSLSMAQQAIDFVLADSQKLLTISNVADKLLNDADFGVSVAEARVSNADPATLEKLALEKEREDLKIVEDTNSRMASIAKGPEEASALIREVTDRVGDDPMHKDRMKAALEAAKRRNAEKEGTGGEDVVVG